MSTSRQSLPPAVPAPPSPEMRRLLAGVRTAGESVRLIRWLHALGRASLAQHPQEKMLPGDLVRETKRLGMRVEQLRKAREFARKYTSSEVNRLCGKIRWNRAPIGFMHVIRLLSVPRKNKERAALQDRMLADQWSVNRLGQEIRRRFGQRRAGARPPKPPTDQDELVGQILGHGDRWSRWFKTVSGRPEPEQRIPLDRLPKTTKQTLVEIDRLFRALKACHGPLPPVAPASAAGRVPAVNSHKPRST